MYPNFGILLKKIARLSYLFGSVCLVVGLILSVASIPASAAGAGKVAFQEERPTEVPACTPPGDWDKTIRFTNDNPSKTWTFEVEEPEMDVTLEFFYYQDYDKSGCPFVCEGTDDCQLLEIGEVESPFGSFTIEDGVKGHNEGSEEQHGRLTQGTYTASFTFTGRGSINVGLKVRKTSLPTDTPLPPPTETPEEPTATSTPTSVTTVLPPLEDTPTPTATEVPSSPTPTSEQPPKASPTPTETPVTTILPPDETPTATGRPPEDTPTPTTTGQPPEEPPTATPTDEGEPPATKAPPTPPPSVTRTPALIPVTGADLSGPEAASELNQRLFINLGIALLGLGMVSHGLSNRIRKP